MMMNARALPVELLDDEELRQRFKQIDEAVERVKQDIAKAVSNSKAERMRVKLHAESSQAGSQP